MTTTLGIIGVGQLAGYFIAGLRHGGDHRPVLLGPRNADTAAALAEKFDCTVSSGNQDTADRSAILLLATRPEDALTALDSVVLHESHLLISVVAGLDLPSLQAHAGPATVVRSLPVFSAEVCAGAMPLYPDNENARELLATLGEVVALEDETRFETAAVMGCTFAWFFRIYAELQSWLEHAGLDPAQARILALQCAHGASSLALAKPEMDLAATADNIARPGTYSLAGEEVYINGGGLSALDDACDMVHKLLRQ